MIKRILKWIVKVCVKQIDRDDTLLCFSFTGGEKKEYHVIVERWLPDCHLFGTWEDKGDTSRRAACEYKKPVSGSDCHGACAEARTGEEK